MAEGSLFSVRGLTAWRLTIGLYIVGYLVYLARAMVWGWQTGVDPYIGFVLWQAIVYAPMWPILLVAFFTQLVIATV